MIKEVAPLVKRWRIKHLLAGSSLALIFLLVITTFGFLKLKETRQSSQWVTHTQSVLALLNAIEGAAFEIGAHQRGYIITGFDKYVDNFENEIPIVNQLLEELQKKTRDNPAQQKNILILQSQLIGQREYMRRTIELVKNGKQVEVVNLVKQGRGQKYMEEIKAILVSMMEHETQLLNKRVAQNVKDIDLANTLVFGGSTFSIIFLLIAFSLMYREFKARTTIQDALNANSQVQEAMLRATAFALIASDTEGRITLFNPAAEKLLGFTAAEMVGKSPTHFYRADEVGAMAEILSERFKEVIPVGFDVFKFRASKNILESDQWTYVKKDGSEIQVNLTTSAIRNSEGVITGFIDIAYDITRQLEYEKAIVEAKDAALQANTAKSEFLANMSHEIRTPMNAIMGMAEILNETKLDEEQKKYVEIFQRSGEGLLSIINDILDLSKIEAGHFELDAQPFRLTNTISKVSEIIAVKAHQKQLELAIDIDGRVPNSFIGDPNRLRQVFLNLLGNAIKFTKRGEVILRIKGRPLGHEYELTCEVLDTGIGMTEEQTRALFTRFSQADSSITREFGGTGLGLNISKKLVEMMKGSIDVQSTAGVGTRITFSMLLPLDESSAPLSPKSGIIGKRILVVDDTRTNRMIVRKILEYQGAYVDEADSGDAAMRLVLEEKLKNRAFDLVLLDCRMPGIDGFSTAEQIIADHPLSRPVIMMLTSDNRPRDLARARKMGLAHYLVKPILKKELLEGIDSALSGQEPLVEDVPVVELAPLLQEELSILLVDDNDENRLVVRAFMKTTRWRLMEARNGQEALNLFQENTFQLILMDMQMPILDGYTATREIRKIEARSNLMKTPILALTAHALMEEVEKSYEAGCDGHLTKPISKSTLLLAVQQHTQGETVILDNELKDLVPDYLANRKKEVEVFRLLLQAQDFVAMQSLGHKLRGAAGSYGFPVLSEIGQAIEDLSQEKNIQALGQQLTKYATYVTRLKTTFR